MSVHFTRDSTPTFYAHSTGTPDRSDWHVLADHLRETGRLAADRGEKFGIARAAQLAGVLHDLGKYSQAFQSYIAGQSSSTDHSTAGARQVLALAQRGTLQDQLCAELIAYAIAGHHAGLPDKVGEDASLLDRLQKPLEPIHPIWQSQVSADTDKIWPDPFRWHPDKTRRPFQVSVLGRMIFSCLVDADFRDTEAFYAADQRTSVDRDWPLLPHVIERLVADFETHLAGIRAAAPTTSVNSLRTEILTHVRSKAALPPGLFTLTVPTGGGKTLVSLAFALDHARTHGMRRIVTAIPFTSVIDQTAAIFREIFGDDLILEHHSALDEVRLNEREGRDKLRLAMEDWAAPIVVTTNVQLFESLFSNRPSRCRKLHNLASSVIILDEAQTIPLPVLRPCVAVLDELARNYGCTIILCTATQPALVAPDFNGGFDLAPERELAPDPPLLHQSLRRTAPLCIRGPMSDDELVAALVATNQALVIVNSRAHALALYRLVKKSGLLGAIHLTTRQTAADRRLILLDVKRRLREGVACRLIATSLVEAGVDIDFPRVWRAEAGLDQIAQAAGRCNREGRRTVNDSIVTVFRPSEAKPPREIQGFVGDMARIMSKHGDLLSPAAMRDYFAEVYWRKGDSLDTHRVLDSFHITHPTAAGVTDFDYRTVGQMFRLIENGMLPVIVAESDQAKEALRGLRGGWLRAGAAARQFQSSIVQVPPAARARLVQNGHVHFVDGFGDQFGELTTRSLYSREVGLLWEDAEYLGLDDLVI